LESLKYLHFYLRLPKATSDMTSLQQGQNPTETESRLGESIASSKQLIVSLHLIEPHPMKAVIAYRLKII